MWRVGKVEESLAESAALLASAIGALLFGRVAGMLGRKRIYGVETCVSAAREGCRGLKRYFTGKPVRLLIGFTLPSAMSSLTAPAVSSMGTLGSTRC